MRGSVAPLKQAGLTQSAFDLVDICTFLENEKLFDRIHNAELSLVFSGPR